MKRRSPLDPIQHAAAKRSARCPDCDSHVTIDESGAHPRINIAHDDSCPALAALYRQGRTASLALVRRADQPAAEFALDVADAASTAAAALGAVTVRQSPYADLHGGATA